jgi:hypothetical protein
LLVLVIRFFGNFSANSFPLNPQGLAFITHPLRLEPYHQLYITLPYPGFQPGRFGFKSEMLPTVPLRSAWFKPGISVWFSSAKELQVEAIPLFFTLYRLMETNNRANNQQIRKRPLHWIVSNAMLKSMQVRSKNITLRITLTWCSTKRFIFRWVSFLEHIIILEILNLPFITEKPHGWRRAVNFQARWTTKAQRSAGKKEYRAKGKSVRPSVCALFFGRYSTLRAEILNISPLVVKCSFIHPYYFTGSGSQDPRSSKNCQNGRATSFFSKILTQFFIFADRRTAHQTKNYRERKGKLKIIFYAW